MKNDLNSILLEGTIVAEPSLGNNPDGTAVCSMAISHNRFFKTDQGIEKDVSFFEVEAYGKRAESAHAQGKEGRGLRVVGRVKQNRFAGADGNARSRIVIVAEHIEFRHRGS